MTWGNKQLTPESVVKNGVKQYLRLRGWFVFPVMQGALSYPGISDFIALKDGKIIFVECKTKTGRQSEHQKNFQIDVERSAGVYLLIRDFEELKAMGY